MKSAGSQARLQRCDSCGQARPSSSAEVAVLWDWEYDADFVLLLERECRRARRSFIAFRGPEVLDFVRLSDRRALSVGTVIDRASDVLPGIGLHLEDLKRAGARIVNDTEKMAWCRDKATMHLELLRAGVRVPYGMIVSTHDHPERLDLMEMTGDKLGTPFVIKPAEGGGGDGVVLNARSRRDVADYLAKSGADKIVLQRKVMPRQLGRRRGWFRVFWVAGKTIPCWWDDLTHIYEPLSPAEERIHGLEALRSITALIAKISGMSLFSTEIAVDEDGKPVVVDFVNEMPDFRPQSGHPDGVPDAVLARIVTELVRGVGKKEGKG
ncbi:MAG: hypothetical protein HY343_06470 [Lentisphaerae bacterium]|nr:hypothetical protein [Lentisphaerota bacterium]